MEGVGGAYLSDGAEHLLLVGVHLCEGADLSQVDVLPVAQRHDLVEGEDQVEAVLRNLALLQDAAVFRDLGNETAAWATNGYCDVAIAFSNQSRLVFTRHRVASVERERSFSFSFFSDFTCFRWFVFSKTFPNFGVFGASSVCFAAICTFFFCFSLRDVNSEQPQHFLFLLYIYKQCINNTYIILYIQ